MRVNVRHATARPVLAQIRALAGGSLAVLLSRDHRVLAADGDPSDRSAAIAAGTTMLLSDLVQRSEEWRDEERGILASSAGPSLLFERVGSHGVVLADLAPTTSIGLVRVRVKPLIAELLRALDDDDASGSGGAEASGSGGAET